VISRALWAAATVGMLFAAPARRPFLRIVSPANGSVVRPGQKLAVKVTGAGDYSVVLILGSEEAVGEIEKSAGKPPWVIWVNISPNAEPGKETLTVMGVETSGTEVAPAQVDIDVEPAEIPPVTFSEPAPLVVPVGSCVSFYREPSPSCGRGLFVSGTYPGGENVDLSRSTRWKVVSRDSSIVKVSGDGSHLFGMAPGSTKVVFFGNYMLDVTVR
jgi:hypothetical protein